MDSRYCFGGGFGFDTRVSTSLLVGNMSSGYQTDAVIVFEGLSPIGGKFKSATVTESRVVPSVDVKLGVDYTYIIYYHHHLML